MGPFDAMGLTAFFTVGTLLWVVWMRIEWL
jgi:hypothetical protein